MTFLIIYDKRITEIKDCLRRVYIFTTLNFTVEKEKENFLGYLDVTLQRMQKHINVSIFSKPTSRDYIIPRDFDHAVDQKFAAIRSF